MSATQGIFLTGATGLLGRYLLRDLLVSGRPVGVLIRDASSASASERLAELQSFCEESLHRSLPRPMLLQGDLRTPGLGLGMVERHWLTRHARAVIHSAAYVSYQPTPDGEPWQTNVLGTRRLLELCQPLGITQMHHLSTAFVCGDRRGLVREDELDCGGGSTNAYERSKFAAEELVRQFPGIQATIYRPSVVVGDSHTGYTCTYHHFYRFLELAVRLSSRSSQRQRIALRLPLTGAETQNLVPVDWVSRALLTLLDRPRWHGRTYHLAAWQSIRLDEIKNILSELLPLEGVQWVGPAGLSDPTPLEQLVLEQFQDYWSYLYSNLDFDCRNIRQALPDLPPPRFDRELAARLLKFAQADNWGRQRGRASPSLPPAGGRPSECAHYLECVLPQQVQRSALARSLPAGFRFALDIRGAERGQWSFRCGGEEILSVERGIRAVPEVVYCIEAETFVRLTRGQQSPQRAFLDGHIEIEGDMEKALKLAVFIEQFLAESALRVSDASQKRGFRSQRFCEASLTGLFVLALLLGVGLAMVGCKAISNRLTQWKMLDQSALEDPIQAVGGDAFVFAPRHPDEPLTRKQLASASPEVLAAYYAPIFVQQRINSQALKYPYPPEYDTIGQAHLRHDEKGKFKAFVAGDPKIYVIFKTPTLEGHPHVQITYTAWYPAHPRMKGFDTEAADIDSCVVRVTLDAEHGPLFYETIMACGCFHKVFVEKHIEDAARQSFGAPEAGKKYSIAKTLQDDIDWEVAGIVEEPRDQPRRPVVFLKAGEHKVIGLGSAARLRAPPQEKTHPYEMVPYSDLYRVVVDGTGREEPFFDLGKGGKVYGAQRKGERLLLSFAGVDSAGQPRADDQIKMHFDQSTWGDPTIYGKYLRLPPGTL